MFKPYKNINNLWGFVDEQLNEIIPCIYNDVKKYYKDGVFWVQFINWGGVNINNEVVIPFIYKEIEFFKNGFYVVNSLNNQRGLMTSNGEIVLPLRYDDIFKIQNIIIAIAIEKKDDILFVELYDFKMKLIQNYNFVVDYGENIILQYGSKALLIGCGRIVENKIIAKTNKIVAKSKFLGKIDLTALNVTQKQSICGQFKNNTNYEGQFMLIDFHGNLVSKNITDFTVDKNGNILVRENDFLYSLYDVNLRLLNPNGRKCSKIKMHPIENNIYFAIYDDRYCLFDKTGNCLFSKQEYHCIDYLGQDMLLISDKMGFGLLNYKNENLVPCVFGKIEAFENGRANAVLFHLPITIDKNGNQLGVGQKFQIEGLNANFYICLANKKFEIYKFDKAILTSLFFYRNIKCSYC